MNAIKEPQRPQPLSAKAYALIAAAGLMLSVGFTLFFIFYVPRLVENSMQDRVFYVLLIPWALASSAFLFGAMQSYARSTSRKFGHTVELGGPVVLFALVLIGGFRLVPKGVDSFDLTVRAHAADGSVPLITEGLVTLELGNATPSERIGPNGEANFKGLSARFKGSNVKVLATVKGFRDEWQELKLTGDVLDIQLMRVSIPVSQLSGTIAPAPRPEDQILIYVEGRPESISPDRLGRFSVTVRGGDGDRVHFTVYRNGSLSYDDFQTLPGPVTLHLKQAPEHAGPNVK
jgi:hypothetical protein